jgi:excisionase family DNA binding protein
MAQKYYTTDETAKALGISEDEVKLMAQRQQLHGYRDGAQWKFRAEEVERLVEQRAAEPPAAPDGGDSDVLLSEIELGPSGSGTSGTVIGGVENGGKPAADTDLKLAEESKPQSAADQLDSKVLQFEELDLALEEDLTLEDSKVTSGEQPASGGSSVDVAGKGLEDDDLVLGGSGAGSDITIGGDSGISLVDPADSGLSLEEPLGAAAVGGEESLELGEDDMLAVAETPQAEAPTELKTDDDFLLTPLEEVTEEEDSESGSQVIALDLDGEESPTMIAGTPGGSGVAAMLDEDLSPAAAADMGFGAALDAAALGTAPLAVQSGALMMEGAPLGAAVAALPEAPYTTWNIVSLSFCTLFLILAGMMMYDLMRNMWSWEGAYQVNSSIMDFILNLF